MAVTQFCEPPLIPGTPNLSVGMEAFKDTPSSTVRPTLPSPWIPRPTASASSMRPTTASGTFSGTSPIPGRDTQRGRLEPVPTWRLHQTDPDAVPQPDPACSPAGPPGFRSAPKAAFLPAPVVIPHQPIHLDRRPDPLRFGNVDQHSLLLRPGRARRRARRLLAVSPARL